MKQQFRDKVPSGNMKTKYWIDKDGGLFDYWITTAELLTEQTTDVVDYYEEIGIKLTNRQLYYQLVGKNYIPNALEIYKRFCTFVTDLRYAGIVDWETIEDRARVPKRPSQWNSVQHLIDSAVSQYRLPRWVDQQCYLEMYCEKEAGVSVLSVISEKYHIYFGFNKGYSSAHAIYNLANRVGTNLENGKRVSILYFGDHDPSGLDMIRDIKTRISEFLGGEDSYDFKIVPVALTKEQVNEYSLPPNPAKITDPRAKWYIRKFGKVSWELDAVDALELRRIAEDAVLDYIDIDKYNAWIKREKTEIEALVNFGKTLTEDEDE